MFDAEFFPTPATIAHKMLSRVSRDARHFLEPSAGKGDIARVIKSRYDSRHVTIDCIEQNPDLAAVLIAKDFSVVGYDWLTYSGVCFYDAVLMNPPFSNGDDHLLKAWDFLYDGEIVCLLNEETIKNPCTAARRRLAEIIAKHGEVEYLGDCFRRAERPAGVNVAMVYLKKTSDDDSMDLWNLDTDEKPVDANVGDDPAMLAIRDNLGNMQHYYDAANEHMMKAFTHIRKAAVYMASNGVSLGYDEQAYSHIVSMALENVNNARAAFGPKHRKDAWRSVFDKMEFRRFLDKKQTDEFIRDIERNANIPFTKENIKGTLENVFMQRRKLFEKSVANVFDELTRYHNGNTSHTEGWKTNDSYKVNTKLVFPWGCEFDHKYMHTFSLRYGSGSIDIYNDLDRILCVLDGVKFEECLTIGQALEYRFRQMKTKHSAVGAEYSTGNNTVQSMYFEIKFWKKGTVHLKFKDLKLWEQFNVMASRGKKWLGEETQRDHRAPAPAAVDEDPDSSFFDDEFQLTACNGE